MTNDAGTDVAASAEVEQDIPRDVEEGIKVDLVSDLGADMGVVDVAIDALPETDTSVDLNSPDAPDMLPFDVTQMACISSQCDDGNPCTTDLCDPTLGCSHTPNAVPCDDKDPCTTGDACEGGKCAPGAPTNCDDENPCTYDSCNAVSGCPHLPTDIACDDGNTCTVDDVCAKGMCGAGPPLDCSDGTPCTTDLCEPSKGCFHVPADGPCDDGDPCTTKDTCIGGACAGGAPPSCDDGNPCTKDECVTSKGCAHSPVDGPCDNGDACTSSDFCAAGGCVGGPVVSCDDQSACTLDACVEPTGCEHTPDPKVCNDGDICTTDVCSGAGECAHLPVAVPCEDGEPCTVADTCIDGVCTAGTPNPCDDGEVCTTDSCTAGKGCVHANLPDGLTCGAGGVCKGGGCDVAGLTGCGDMTGLDPEAAWPMDGYCPTRISRSPYKLSLDSFDIQWKAPLGAAATSSPVAKKNGMAFVGTAAGKVVSVDAGGTVLWTSAAPPKPVGAVNSLALIPGGIIIAADGEHAIRALSTADGSLLWSNLVATEKTGSISVGPDGTIYAAGNQVVALSKDGEEKWAYGPAGATWYGPALAVDGTLIASSPIEGLVALGSDGKAKWAVTQGVAGAGWPVIANDLVIVLTNTTLVAFPVASTIGAPPPKWTVPLPVLPAVPPPGIAAAKDGSIALAAGNYLETASHAGTVTWFNVVGPIASVAPLIDAADTIVHQAGSCFAWWPKTGGGGASCTSISFQHGAAITADGFVYVGCGPGFLCRL